MSFWSSQDKIPVRQSKVALQVENGLDFKSKQTLHFHIPAQVGFIQPKETYLRFDVKIDDSSLTGSQRFMLDKMGGSCLIRDITIRSGGAGGVVLEEIQNYNVLTGLRYSYEQNQSIRNKRCLTEGGAQHNEKSASTMHNTMSDTNNVTENAYFECFESSTAPQTTAHVSKKVKCLLPLHTGIFQNDKVFPVMLTEGLRVEILLEDAPRCIIPLSQVSDNCHLNEKVYFHSLSGDDDLTDVWDAPGALTPTIYVRRDNSQGSAATFPFAVGEYFDLVDYSQNQSEGTTGNTNAQAAILSTDNPMQIASIKHYPYNALAIGTTVGGKWGITEITLAGGGVTRNDALYNNRQLGSANTPAAACWVMVSKTLQQSSVDAIDYEISDVEMIIQKLEMPQGYTSKLMSMMKGGGALNYDFLSYRNYKYSAVKNDTQVNMRLPLVESRAKSILCVPTDASTLSRKALIQGTPCDHDSTLNSMVGTQWEDYTTARAALFGYDHNNERILSDKTDHGGTAANRYVPNYSQRTGLVGIGDNLTNYQLFYGGQLNPSRKVECAAVTSGRCLEQQWAIEAEKSLAMGGIKPLSFRDLHENWFIGRALSLQDGVYDARNKDFNLQLAYEGVSTADPTTSKAPTRNKLWCNYCAHIRRMVIRGSAISVEV